jgi:glycosyltransferase involved in cell wall biosynthesis
VKILLIPSNYKPFFNAGGETYLHAMAKGLQGYGHEVKAIVNYKEAYEYDGIECIPQGSLDEMWTGHKDLMNWCDAVVTQLIGTAYAYNKAHQFNKPLIFISHNEHRSYPINEVSNQNTWVIYNSEYLKKVVNFPHKSIVFQPAIDFRNFKISPFSKRKYITLINCNANKGGNEFIRLAESLPQYQFLGIKGPKSYGEQLTAELPNLTYIENSRDISEWMGQTKLLLAPSSMETYGQAATEAICMGIPVICSPLPGLKENLSHCGIYIDRKDVNLYAHTIQLLFEDEAYYRLQSGLCLKRALELDPKPRFKELNNWLLNIEKWQMH